MTLKWKCFLLPLTVLYLSLSCIIFSFDFKLQMFWIHIELFLYYNLKRNEQVFIIFKFLKTGTIKLKLCISKSYHFSHCSEVVC